MIAQYLETPQLKIHRPQTTLFNRVKFKAIIPPKNTEAHVLNYHNITILSREIADSLMFLSENNIISKSKVKYFVDKADRDVDYLESLYRKNNKMDNIAHDFMLVIELFQGFARKSLSEFQIKSDKYLLDLLTVSYAMRYTLNTVSFISWAAGKKPNKTVENMVKSKLAEVEKVFTKRYSEVSNVKSFDFNRYHSVFEKIKGMNHKEFTAFAEEIQN